MRWAVLVWLLFSSLGVQGEEKVNAFHSDIRIAADGWLTVTETIDVNVEGRQIKRGILRDFPTDYQDRFGRKVTVPFEVVSVRRDGRDERYSVERKSNGASVRIGDPGSMLAHRRHSYQIAYRTRFQVGFFDAHDELYWNVNGNGWTFAMDAISANVSVSPELPASRIKVEAYTGPFGAKGRDYTAEALNGGASFRTTRRLAAGEGLTIVVMFPKGVVLPPTLRDRFDRWLDDNLGEAIGAAGLLVFLSFLYWRWAQVGRDPRAGPAYPRYEAPRELGPGAMRYIDRMEYDGTCFTAALLGLAQRGFLRIREDSGVYELERTGKTVPFTPGDVPVAALVPKTGAASVSAAYDPAVATAQAGLSRTLAAEVGARMYSLNRGTVAMGFVLAAATLFVMHVMNAALVAMIAAGAVMLVALIVAGKLLPAYTPEGRKAMDEIDGLRQYLSVAEKDDLAREKRPPRTKEEFAKFLPYAVALGVEKTWADAFTAVLGAAALAAAAGEYFSSSSSDPGQPGFSPAGFGDALSGIGDTISAASTPPASSSGSSGGSDSGGSSSSSGGGSSGGGGGGGGGSGW